MGTRSRTEGRSSDVAPRDRLGRAFFDRPGAALARALLGARLVLADDSGLRVARLVETEAYLRGDAASHAFRGPTRRNRSMFGPPGTLYVYRIHQVVCANLVARRGEAALLRAGEVAGAAVGDGRGPGRLCRALGITIADDGADAVRGPRVALLPREKRPGRIAVGRRIGIRLDPERPLRFWIVGARAVSGPRRVSASVSPSRSRVAAQRRRSRTTRRPSFDGGRSGGRSAGR
jgi:DNA-3-methyladenine glycosylase